MGIYGKSDNQKEYGQIEIIIMHDSHTASKK